jgi:cell division protein FtsL
VVGAFAIVTGGVSLQKLNQLTAFADADFIVSIYLSATLLTALGVLAIIYLVRVLLAKKMQPSEQQPKSPEEIELHPYEPDVTEAR